MDKLLSVYFSSHRTYLAVVERNGKGLRLDYVNSTTQPIDLEAPEDGRNEEAAEELKELLRDLDKDITRVAISLPADSVLVTKIPGKKTTPYDEIQKLVELEIRQAYPQFNYEDFIPSAVNFAPKLDGKEVMLATIIPKQNFVASRNILNEVLEKPITNIEISQLNAHSAFLYNYPKRKKESVAILGVGDNFVDVSVLKSGELVYYSLSRLDDPEEIADVCLEEFDQITEKYVEELHSAYFFGEGLNIDALVIAQSLLTEKVPNIGKLNAFRMFTSNLSERERQYCSRSAHIFPPCIGGCLPPIHKKIKLYGDNA